MKPVLQTFAAASACVFLAACGGGSDTSSQTPRTDKLAAVTVVGTQAVFSGARANYTIIKTADGYSVLDSAGADGTTNLAANVNRLQFSDLTVNPSVAEQAQGISAADLKTLIELYIAFFNRVPEADGLAFWIGRFWGGQTIDQISEDFYSAAIQYPSLTGYAVSMTPAEFVRIIYRNVLGRTGDTAPPEEDVQFWAGRITSGAATKGTLIRTMLDSAHTFTNDRQWGWVPALLDNKYTVGHFFAVQQGINYNTAEQSIQRTMEIAAAVTPLNISAAIARIPVSASASAIDPSSPRPLPASPAPTPVPDSLPAPVPTPVTGSPAPAPLPTPPAVFSVEALPLPANGATVTGVIELFVKGTGIRNAELLPANGYTPLYARFSNSADGTGGWASLDTRLLPDGPLTVRISAWDAPAGSSDAREIIAMAPRTWNVKNTAPAPAPTPTPAPAPTPAPTPAPAPSPTPSTQKACLPGTETGLSSTSASESHFSCQEVDLLPTSQVVGFFRGWTGQTTVPLKNGQTWFGSVIEGTAGWGPTNLFEPTVMIYRTAGGRYYMTINGGPPVWVERIN